MYPLLVQLILLSSKMALNIMGKLLSLPPMYQYNFYYFGVNLGLRGEKIPESVIARLDNGRSNFTSLKTNRT